MRAPSAVWTGSGRTKQRRRRVASRCPARPRVCPRFYSDFCPFYAMHVSGGGKPARGAAKPDPKLVQTGQGVATGPFAGAGASVRAWRACTNLHVCVADSETGRARRQRPYSAHTVARTEKRMPCAKSLATLLWAPRARTDAACTLHARVRALYISSRPWNGRASLPAPAIDRCDSGWPAGLAAVVTGR